MKKLFSLLTMLTFAAGFSARAYDCPENLYFYESNAGSTQFEKTGDVFTYSVDATEGEVFGVIVSYNAADWDEAHGHTAYFANGKWGDIEIGAPETWTSVSEWGTGWSNGCYKFVAGKVYDITLTYADGAFTGKVSVNGSEDPIVTPDDPVIETKGFEVGKDYFIDAANCSWFFDGGAIIKVWDGAQNLVCEKVSGSVVKFCPTAAGTNGMMYVKRIDPNNENTTWNEYGLSAPTNEGDNYFILNSNFSGGEWKVYSTPEAWIISKNVNDWSAEEVSEYKFDYDETTGLYTISVPADKLRCEDADSNGFKIGYGNLNDWGNYYGAVIKDKVMGKGIATDAVKNGQNFLIPVSATTPVHLSFDAKEGKLTADWDITPVDPDDPIGPVDSEDVLVVNEIKMDVNGSISVEVALNAAADKNYCTGQWNITVPAGFTVSDIVLNNERAADHELMTNVVDGETRCIAYSIHNTPFANVNAPLFSFTLTAENVTPGDLTGLISNILFSVPPVDGNLNISSKFADTPINITAVKAVSKITADPANLALSAGESKSVALTIEPADATDSSVTWEIVAGENIIDLTQDGTITAKNSGVATVKVTANDGFGAFVMIDVTVDGKKVENITLNETECVMYIGDSMTLVATVTPDDATNKSVMWVSSDDNVATVDSNGVITGISAGEAVIHAVAKDGSGVEATCNVTIKAKVSGDADGDDELTILDIVIIVKNVVGIETEGAIFENMDMDRDGKITSTDVTLAVYYLNQVEITQLPSKARMSDEKLMIEAPVFVNDNLFHLPVSLSNALNEAGVQFDIVLPEGFELAPDSQVAPEASNGHVMSVASIGENAYRVEIYSAYNFRNDEIAYISVRDNRTHNGSADLQLKNVMFTDGVSLLANEDSSNTLSFSGIDSIFGNDESVRYNVYNTLGMLIVEDADRNAVNALPAGIYIIGSRKVIVR